MRLRVPAAATATADADAVVIRAQNRAGRGRSVQQAEPIRPVARPAVQQTAPQMRTAPQTMPAPAPAPASGIRPVSGHVESHPHVHGAPAVHSGPAVQGGVPQHAGPHGGYADCPQCYGNCPPGGCPTCLGTHGLAPLPPCGLFAQGGPFHRGGTFVPQHRHEYSYNAPEGYLYPPGANPNVPGKMGPMPVTQYPYYTTKGPDDYFHDRDGEY
ncbi:hypothetical protein LzC2_32490 [Planctomycetes bacterium LzC2]|uniref:Uncharacterized protein n=1 Tax=Alienimonas chondri TaxID=2681879 RepID=A0ABX1VGB9_9PLAN|nr:hypothetical protein [Alienimonas chondri]